MKQKQYTEKDIKTILTNPFLTMSFDGEQPTISENDFIEAGKIFIEEEGVENYIKGILHNTKEFSSCFITP